MSDDEPLTPADPRPDGEPFYIDADCPNCGATLGLYDELDDEALRSSDAFVDPEYQVEKDAVWHDEWACYECLDGVHMDWPPAKKEKHANRVEGALENIAADNWQTLDEVADELDIDLDDNE